MISAVAATIPTRVMTRRMLFRRFARGLRSERPAVGPARADRGDPEGDDRQDGDRDRRDPTAAGPAGCPWAIDRQTARARLTTMTDRDPGRHDDRDREHDGRAHASERADLSRAGPASTRGGQCEVQPDQRHPTTDGQRRPAATPRSGRCVTRPARIDRDDDSTITVQTRAVPAEALTEDCSGRGSIVTAAARLPASRPPSASGTGTTHHGRCAPATWSPRHARRTRPPGPVRWRPAPADRAAPHPATRSSRPLARHRSEPSCCLDALSVGSCLALGEPSRVRLGACASWAAIARRTQGAVARPRPSAP